MALAPGPLPLCFVVVIKLRDHGPGPFLLACGATGLIRYPPPIPPPPPPCAPPPRGGHVAL